MIRWKLAIRFFLHRPSSWLAAVAVALCVFIVIIVLTVMNGLLTEFKEKNHAYVGDCVITTDSLVGFPAEDAFLDSLRAQPFIEAVSPAVYGVGLVTQPGAQWNIGVEFMGIDPVLHSAATGFGQSLYYHQDNPAQAFVPPYAPDKAGCVVGIDLIGGRRTAQGEYLHPETMTPMRLILSSFPLTAKGSLARAGTDLVSSATYFVADDSHTGLPMIDGAMIYLPLDQSRLLTGMDSPRPRISSIHIRFKPGVPLARGVGKVRQLWNEHRTVLRDSDEAKLLEQVRVQSWQENRRARIAAVEKEQNMLILLFLMLGVITVFIIFVIFYMIVGHKSRDIGILKSVGVSNISVWCIFLNYAAMIGILGAVVGVAAGVLFLNHINSIEDLLFDRFGFQLWNRSIYAIGEIPSTLRLSVLAGVSAAAVGACLLGALIPALQAARKQPAKVLQVNQM